MILPSSHRSNPLNDSIASTQRYHIDTRPFNRQPKVQKSRAAGSKINQSAINIKNQVLNAIKFNSMINKLQINPQFIQLLNNSYCMEKIVIVSIWGAPQSGKSFLIDSLLSANDGITMRVFSKSQNDGANCSLRRIQTKDKNPIVFLDWQGIAEANQQMQSNIFLLMYLISSAIIYNYNSFDIRYQVMFIEFCEKAKNKLISDEVEYSLPQLISIRRDVTSSNNRATDFIECIYKLQMFQPNSTLFYLPYPGDKNIGLKQIIDVPVLTLDKTFVKVSASILEMLRTLKPMYINDNPVTSNILGILIVQYANLINRYHRVVIDTCWKSVLEALAVNGHNHYVTVYTEYLQQQFKDEKPLSRYELFQKLFKVKSLTDNKLQNFTNIRGDPIFDKCKDKLKQFIKVKQQMIKSINTSKANLMNSRYVSDMKRSSFLANQPIKEQSIMKYISSFRGLPQDSNKSEIVLASVKDLMQNELKKISSNAQAPELKNLSKTLGDRQRTLNNQISTIQGNTGQLQKKIKQTQNANNNYLIKIQQKQGNLRQVISQNARKDKQRKDSMTAQQKQAQMMLQKQKQKLNSKLQNQREIIQQLKSQIGQINSQLKKQEGVRAEAKSRLNEQNKSINLLNTKIGEKQKVLKERNHQINRLKELLDKPEKKKTTCGCFG